MVLLQGEAIDLVLWLSIVMIAISVTYGLMLLIFSRLEPIGRAALKYPNPALPSDKTVIFVLPCLNEDRVIGASVKRLLEIDYPRAHILVIDDGSDDNTAGVVQSFKSPRVHLLQRVLPQARKGKGEALNAAIRHIVAGNITPITTTDDVIVCVVDADGRLETQTLDEVMPLFEVMRLGAVQIGVRINNRHQDWLARMQDVEFVLYTEVFQRGRRHLGSVGLGGNGQFVRLSALLSLKGQPWTDSLAEDLDLGVRLLVAGWRTDFCYRASVHQQGLVDVKRWLKQRTRWFQGHLQSWGLVPSLLRDLRGMARVDLLYHLTSPYLLLVVSFLSLAFLMWGLQTAVALAVGTMDVTWWWLSVYLVAFGPAMLYGILYWRRERGGGFTLVHSLIVMHTYVGYALLWYLAGWRAAARSLIGRTGWTKTDRNTEEEEADEEVSAPELPMAALPPAPEDPAVVTQPPRAQSASRWEGVDDPDATLVLPSNRRNSVEAP